MSTEHAYIKSIHSRIPRSVHKWKIAANFVRGIPDAWYSGSDTDLWVEYKYLKRRPVRSFTPALSANQKRWLRDRHKEGRNVAVIVGTPDGAAILLDREWEGKVEVPSQWFTQKEVAAWITAFTSTPASQAPLMAAS